jgi:hypothetical protein
VFTIGSETLRPGLHGSDSTSGPGRSIGSAWKSPSGWTWIVGFGKMLNQKELQRQDVGTNVSR